MEDQQADEYKCGSLEASKFPYDISHLIEKTNEGTVITELSERSMNKLTIRPYLHTTTNPVGTSETSRMHSIS